MDTKTVIIIVLISVIVVLLWGGYNYALEHTAYTFHAETSFPQTAVRKLKRGSHCHVVYKRSREKLEASSLNLPTLYQDFNRSANASKLYVTANYNLAGLGRLGNALFQYAAILGVAHANNRIPVVNVGFTDRLSHCLDYSLPLDESIIKSSSTNWLTIPEDKPHTYQNKTLNLPHRNVSMWAYLQSRLYFLPQEKRLRKTLAFKPAVLSRVKKYLGSLTAAVWTKEKVHRVLIHVRLTDFLGGSYKGYNMPNSTYFQEAMDYFRSCYDNLQFIVLSEDIATAKKLVYGDGIVYSEGLTPCEDMALASLCDHAILTYGSFGAWAGWFANGVTVTWKHFLTPNSTAEQMLKKNLRYFYPDGTITL